MANYMRQTLNAMDEQTFALFIKYHLSICERPDLIGAAAHTLDILQVGGREHVDRRCMGRI